MTALAMSRPTHPHTNEGGYSYQPANGFQPQATPGQLPPIRELFPFFNDDNASSIPNPPPRAAPITPLALASTSPYAASASVSVTPEYTHASAAGVKRQRASADSDEARGRLSQVPRRYDAPHHLERPEPTVLRHGARPSTAAGGPSLVSPAAPAGSATSPPSSAVGFAAPFSERAGGDPRVFSPPRSSRRPLPTLPHLRHDRPPTPSRLPRGSFDDTYNPPPPLPSSGSGSGSGSGSSIYGYPPARQSSGLHHPQAQHVAPPGHAQAAGAHAPYTNSNGPNPYHQHPSRVQSLSVDSIRGLDRAAFPPSSSGGPYHHHSYHPEYMQHERYRPGDYPGLAPAGEHTSTSSGGPLAGEHKPRKRRGNLPKETTDVLRAWFHAHLSHPYPTEDEKQEMMRQTGLQMNQISNWFINARRRQLPGILNNGRTESGITSSVRRGSSMIGIHGGSVGVAGVGGAMRQKALPPAHGVYSSPEHMYERPSVRYGNGDHADGRNSSPSDDDFDDLPRRPSSLQRGSV